MLNRDSVIATVNAFDAHNFDQLKEHLNSSALLPDDVVNLYTIHHEAISPLLNTSRARNAAALFVLCQKHLVLGTISLFRLYSAQMFRETRAAVEAAGIAHLIQTDAKSFEVFSQDDGSEAARKLARKTFTSRALYPSSIPQLALLSDFYDTASMLSHTSGITFVRHLSAGQTVGQMKFGYQDIQRENISRELPKQMFWLCNAHLAILMAADVVFAGLDVDLSKFRQKRKDIFERVQRFNAAHDQSLLNT
ncbi:MAG: hypothetical protein EBY17_14085 [Acidobacteriia bacterium]|nr:hypothetical protein [Terriglobia bacterium]